MATACEAELDVELEAVEVGYEYEYALRLGLKATAVCALDWRRERGSVKVVAIASALLQLRRQWLQRQTREGIEPSIKSVGC